MKAHACIFLFCVVANACGGGEGGKDDAVEDADVPPDADFIEEGADVLLDGECGRNADCANGLVCDGEERCVDGVCRPGTPPDCGDNDPCTTDSCSEDEGGCVHEPLDADGDGYIAKEAGGKQCGGVDCDDANAEAFPGAPELCTDGVDQDCDGDPDCSTHENCNALGQCEIKWVAVEVGTFMMGSPGTEPGRDSNKETQHAVTLTHMFEIQATEVTQGQFEKLMGYNPSYFQLCGVDCPVEYVTWHEAAAYCNALSMKEALDVCYACSGSESSIVCSPNAGYETPYDCLGYRLPTEAEWEYAARAGTTTSTYDGDIDSSHLHCEMPNVLDSIAWFCGNAGNAIQHIGGKSPNALGLYDMLGNASEWCHGWYEDYCTEENCPETVNPYGPTSGSNQVSRGGCWHNPASLVRAAKRFEINPVQLNDGLGFRPVRTLP